MTSFPTKYLLSLSFEEAQTVRRALYAACGGSHEQFNDPANAHIKELWYRVAELTSEETFTRSMFEETAKWGCN